jgi:hypothetical protein
MLPASASSAWELFARCIGPVVGPSAVGGLRLSFRVSTVDDQ